MDHTKRQLTLVWFAAALAAGWVAFFLLRAVTMPLGSGDAPIYQAMAEHPWVFTRAPHGYRILVPWLAHAVMALTGASVSTAFLAVSGSLFAALAATLAWWAIRIEHADGWLAAQISLLFACSYAGLYNAHNFIHVGFGEYLVLVAGLAAIRAERFAAVLAVATAGVLVKESAAALVPMWFVYELGRPPWRRLLLRALLITSAVLAVFLALHTALFPNAVPAHAAVYTGGYLKELRAYWVSPYNVIMRISDTFGALWPMAAAGFLCADGLSRRLAVLVPLALAQIAVATDISRMAATALPAVLFFALAFLRRLPRVSQAAVTVLALAVFFAYDYQLPVTRWLLLTAYLAVAALFAWNHPPLRGRLSGGA